MDEQQILQTLNDLKTLIYDGSSQNCVRQTENKDIVLFMGNTRAGKSTVVNCAIGNQLKAEHVSKTRYRINHASPDCAGPKIGVESISETTLPTAWNSRKMSGLIVDSPGFDDNRGEAQDVANVYHIKNIVTSAASVKIVLILDINDIANDNVGHFISLVDKVKLMFPTIPGNVINSATTFVLTKDNIDTTPGEVCEYFNQKVLSQHLMKVNNRELVQYLTENQNHIVLIKMPDAERILNDNDPVFDDLINTIENVSSKVDKSQFQNVNFGISDKSRAFLYTAHARLSEHQDFENVYNQCLALFTQELTYYDQAFGDVNHGNNLKAELHARDERIQGKINIDLSINESLQTLKDSAPNSTAFTDGIYTKLDFIKFVDQILGVNYCDSIKTKTKATLTSMKSLVLQKIPNVQARIEQLHREEQERLRVAEEERIRRENEELERIRQANEAQRIEIARLQEQQHCGGRRDDCTLQ